MLKTMYWLSVATPLKNVKEDKEKNPIFMGNETLV